MRCEHLVQVHGPLRAPAAAITRRHLWAALVLRAEDPTRFLPALHSCRIDRRESVPDEPQRLHRTLDFGSFVVNDRATVTPDALVIDTRAGPTWPTSRLTIRIEQPEPQSLFLRFIYESDDADGSEPDAITDAVRRRAYEAADLDMVARIRELVEDGALGD